MNRISTETGKIPSEKASNHKKSIETFEKKRLKIIKKAMRLFIKKGYAQSSMREISQVTGIDSSYLYKFIKNKEEILYLAFEQVHSPAMNIFDKLKIEEIEDPEKQLRSVIRELMRSNYDFKAEIALLYRESKHLPKKYLKIICDRESQLIHRIEQILITLNERRKLNIQNFSYVANMIVYQASFYPLRSWNFRNCSEGELADLTEDYIMNAIMSCPDEQQKMS
ncbi:MAG: TetR/AcrR family transcriptional regulator [Deltaproteobacteria bacterium]